MTIQAECITFHIDNTVKLVTGNHINLYTHNWCIYIHRLNSTSSTLAVRIEIHVWLYHNEPCIMYHLVLPEYKNALFKLFFQQSIFQCCNIGTRLLFTLVIIIIIFPLTCRKIYWRYGKKNHRECLAMEVFMSVTHFALHMLMLTPLWGVISAIDCGLQC